MNNSPTIGFIGGGNMASSLIGGLLEPSDNMTQVAAENIWVFDLNQSQLNSLQASYGINIAASNLQIVENCEVVVLAVKPQIMNSVLPPLGETIRRHKPLLISIAAGFQVSSIEDCVAAPCAVVRVMPNTPALIGMGASGMFANNMVSQQQRDITEQLIAAVGIYHWVESEAAIDSITALSGSGPAYFMLFIQSLIEAAQKNGIDEKVAHELAIQTALGAAQLIKQSDQPIQTLIDNVSSPNGTTERAIKSFKDNQLADIVAQAFNAAKSRSEEMAGELS